MKKKIIIYNEKEQIQNSFIGKRPFVMNREKCNLLLSMFSATIERMYNISPKIKDSISEDAIKKCMKYIPSEEADCILRMASMIEYMTEILEKEF